ncbi:putative F-box/FBD/LRR-repeat protein [Raphanus sativus]|uniref:F-box/FBD/LRR-repeat protein At5g22670 n=1 Tax=Raphanus sativus TaxID=3726 RepID=A0A9W3DDR3_RAPSA|nr:putative F-box/FBD/LRR-repeat protein At5g22670 [Raphanus sativus]XP_056861543.1 putative F-box/FBD/LRR-repeat protein At5g22670 [Raphanus sativus]KAJ4907989.1 putative F-box/FBD/LRR-repeat protein [Raphanus sativus]
MSERGTSCCRSEEDRISFLPDDLLCEILSHVPTKTGVMTSVLSTRWRTIWLSIPILDLHTDDFPNFTALASFTSWFLDGSSCLHKLKLAFGSLRTIQDISNELLKLSFNFGRNIQDISNEPSYLMTQWINSAVTRKVQHLDITFLYPWIVEMMPLSIYTCETIVSLKLCNVSLADSENVSLPCLKIMHLVGNVYTSNAFLEKLISSCPVLEELTVVRNRDTEYDLRVLRVCSKSLKSLVVDLDGRKCWYRDFRVVVIDAPGLNNLRLKDNQFTSYVISNLSSSAKVDIDVSFAKRSSVPDMTTSSSKRSVMRSFFTMLSSVRDMTISQTTLEGICLYLKHEPVPQFPYLIRLHAVLYSSDLRTLPNILQICPNLKSLVLALSYLRMEELHVFSSSSVPECLRSSLECVEIKTPIRGAVTEIELVKYLLENSVVLRKFKMCLRRRRMNEESNISMKLLRLRRCSPSCEVVVQLK